MATQQEHEVALKTAHGALAAAVAQVNLADSDYRAAVQAAKVDGVSATPAGVLGAPRLAPLEIFIQTVTIIFKEPPKAPTAEKF